MALLMKGSSSKGDRYDEVFSKDQDEKYKRTNMEFYL